MHDRIGRHEGHTNEKARARVRRELDSLITQMYAGGITYAEAVREFKRRFLLEVLIANRGNQCKAAIALEVHRNTLSRMMTELQIEPSEVRAGMKRPPRAERPRFEEQRTGTSLR
jgi:Fis family transcriptional regulator